MHWAARCFHPCSLKHKNYCLDMISFCWEYKRRAKIRLQNILIDILLFWLSLRTELFPHFLIYRYPGGSVRQPEIKSRNIHLLFEIKFVLSNDQVIFLKLRFRPCLKFAFAPKITFSCIIDIETEDHMLDWHSCQICYPLEIKLLCPQLRRSLRDILVSGCSCVSASVRSSKPVHTRVL